MVPNEIASWLLFAAVAVAAAAASVHALLFKREPRAALGWIAVCLVFPAFGPLLYFLFGINRIRTRAKRLHAPDPEAVRHRLGTGAPPGLAPGAARTPALMVPTNAALADLARLGSMVTDLPLTPGNAITCLRNGEEAFPAMLEAIASAERFVYLATYIFDSDATGRAFVEALAAARSRGVEVRVLVDGVGELYSRPRVRRLLAAADVPVARFLPPRLLPPQVNINLRTHRKILLVDGRRAFTGGMNIGDRHLVELARPGRVADLHFRLEGPVAGQIEAVFREDWEFVTGEALPPSAPPPGSGDAWARAVADGPNEDLDRLLNLLVGAMAAARNRVRIMNPYFLPPRELVSAMKSATLRGVDVHAVLPSHSNLPYVHWASRNTLAELLEWGVRVWYQPAPFAHTKLFLVDDEYVQLGSANLDPRSLRLNFELSVEVFDRELAARCGQHFDRIRSLSREVTVKEIESRPLWVRIRDASAWLMSPYL